MRVSRWSRAPGQGERVGDEVERYLNRNQNQKPESLDLVLESIKISGLGGSVVCDRIVKLVLGDVGLEFEENGGKRKNGEGERFERGTGQQI